MLTIAQALNYIISPTIAESITPSDVTEYQGIQKILVWWAGDLAVTMIDLTGADIEVVFTNVQAWDEMIISPKQIKSTNTTATLIVAMYPPYLKS